MPDPRRLIEDYLPIEAISAKGSLENSILLTTNERYKAAQLGDRYWLFVVWDPLGTLDLKPLTIYNPVKHLDHATREVVTAWCYDISAEAIEQAASDRQ